MMIVAPSLQPLASWLRSRVLNLARLSEGLALSGFVLALVAAVAPLWFLFAYRPDQDHPVNRLLQACQLGARRGSLATVGVGAAIVSIAWAGAVLGQLVWRAIRDLKRMRALSLILGEATADARMADGVSTTVFLVPDRVAFTAGLLRPRVYLGAELLAALCPEETEAVVLHEAEHRRRYDPLRCWLVELVLSSLCWRPAGSLGRHYRAAREADADRAAIRAQGDDRPLLRALAKADGLKAGPGACGLSPDRQTALRQIRHMDNAASPAAGLTTALALALVSGMVVLMMTGLTDWQWYRFCPQPGSLGS